MAEGTIQVRPQELPEPTWETDWVEALPGKDGVERVVVWEQNPQHPGGEAFLAPGPPRLVALTPEVNQAVRNGLLRRVPEPALTLEEHLHYTGQHGDTVGTYHHIAKAVAPPPLRLKPRLKPTAGDRKPAELKAEPPPDYHPEPEPRHHSDPEPKDEKRR